MTVSKVPVAEKQTNNGGLCMCGCGTIVPGYFKRGHVSGFNGRLRRIKDGEDTPIRLLGRSMAGLLGPWITEGDGKVPTKTYKDLR